MKRTVLIMSSGKRYVTSQDIEYLNDNFFTHKDGSLINGIVYMEKFAINPSHISSVEYLKENEEPDEDDELVYF